MSFITVKYLKRAKVLRYILDGIMLIPRLILVTLYMIGSTLTYVSESLRYYVDKPQRKIERFVDGKLDWHDIAVERLMLDKAEKAEVTKKGKNSQ